MSDLMKFLVQETGLTMEDLARIIRTAPSRYKQFTIPKRNGGTREIAQPSREVKALQRLLVDRVLSGLPVHPAATAYRKGKSIRENAAMHIGHGPILKMDFEDFFPSIRSDDWEHYCHQTNILTAQDLSITTQIFFRRKKNEHIRKLSIGAPSSPALCNILMFRFDELVAGEAERRGIHYTRYADDLTFSGQRIGMLKDMTKVVEQAVRSIRRPRLRVNARKTTFVTAARRRLVTGVVLTNDGDLSVGRDRKRAVSAGVHRASLGQLTPEALAELAGQLAFINVVEPTFLSRLTKRYGLDVIKSVQGAPFVLRAQVP